ncbi:prothymosin alpha isoform X2 [Vulpes vulpes]|uniref:Prothymosin alpha n=1 Tax=Vulpes vulpes TaxID=9627 RepID=A0ABM4XB67_VULVU
MQREGPARGGLRWKRREARKGWRAGRAAAGPAQPAGSGSPGSGAHSAAPGHVLRARGACRGPRAKPAGRGLRACAPRSPRPHPLPGASAARGRERAAPGFAARRPVVMGSTGAPGPLAGRRPSCARPGACLRWRLDRQGQVEKLTGLRAPAARRPLGSRRRPPLEDLKEKKEVVEEAENGRDAPANGNANEENGEQEADNEVDEEEEEGGEEEEEEEEGDGEEEDGDEDEEAEAATGKRAAEDDEDDDVDTKKQKTDEDD